MNLCTRQKNNNFKLKIQKMNLWRFLRKIAIKAIWLSFQLNHHSCVSFLVYLSTIILNCAHLPNPKGISKSKQNIQINYAAVFSRSWSKFLNVTWPTYDIHFTVSLLHVHGTNFWMWWRTAQGAKETSHTMKHN